VAENLEHTHKHTPTKHTHTHEPSNTYMHMHNALFNMDLKQYPWSNSIQHSEYHLSV